MNDVDPSQSNNDTKTLNEQSDVNLNEIVARPLLTTNETSCQGNVDLSEVVSSTPNDVSQRVTTTTLSTRILKGICPCVCCIMAIGVLILLLWASKSCREQYGDVAQCRIAG